jgi:hypothetical protein
MPLALPLHLSSIDPLQFFTGLKGLWSFLSPIIASKYPDLSYLWTQKGSLNSCSRHTDKQSSASPDWQLCGPPTGNIVVMAGECENMTWLTPGSQSHTVRSWPIPTQNWQEGFNYQLEARVYSPQTGRSMWKEQNYSISAMLHYVSACSRTTERVQSRSKLFYWYAAETNVPLCPAETCPCIPCSVFPLPSDRQCTLSLKGPFQQVSLIYQTEKHNTHNKGKW